MINPNLLRNDLYVVAKKLIRRNFKLDIIMIIEKENKRKKLQIKIEKLQSERNFKSKCIGLAKLKGEDIHLLCQDVIILTNQLNDLKNELNILKTTFHKYLLSLPNIPADDVPDGFSEKDNLEIFRWGKPKEYNFSIRDHIELGKIINGLDFSAAVKITGTRFIVMRNCIARMHRALIQFMLNLHTEQHGYEEYYLPYLVNQKSLYGTGQLPKFNTDIFYTKLFEEKNITNNTYALIPTAEVPLINLIRDQIFEEDILPIKMTAHTPCFRSEAGSYGRDTRGLIRMHQFDKVEMVQVVKPEESIKALEEITFHAEMVLQLLNLPYRKMLVCTGDMSFSSCKTYDLEVWLPAQNSYREISSCSNVNDFQSRRIQARYRCKKNRKLRLLHTLNGSGLAVGRTLIAILENYQLADGSIEVPMVLRSYMGGLKYIR